jgi:chromosome segregation ATPase
MFAEYNALQQLKRWLGSELSWLQSEGQRLDTLKAQLDQATRDLAHWNDMVQNQQATINKTQNDLDIWTSKKNQLTSQLGEAQNKVDQLTAQVKSLESQEAQIQSSLIAAQTKEKQLTSSIQSNQAEVSRLQEDVATRSKEKSEADSDLRKVENELQKARQQAEELRGEITKSVLYPYLRWGGTTLLTISALTLMVGMAKASRPTATTLQPVSRRSRSNRLCIADTAAPEFRRF